MLFNSHYFILGFLPLVVAIYFALNKADDRWRLSWLLLASLIFYGWWNPLYLPLLMASVIVNYAIGTFLATSSSYRYPVLITGIIFNLGLLAYFKYAGFTVTSINAVAGADLSVPSIVLPLAISFFTFQQIAFLVDAFRGFVGKVSPLNYAVFVTFFPQLIAGPIVHHQEMMPQFSLRQKLGDMSRLATALSMFSIGLFKKAVIADGLAPTANYVFSDAGNAEALSWLESSVGVLAYTFQLYFDFSGYSDMAIGLALLFGIRLPVNFRSPYKAASISEFWRCWHMTLSRFLRDYLYIPLGGNRNGVNRRYLNLMITMLLGGLWHGAGWTFVIWGGLHGLLLMLHQLWLRFSDMLRLPAIPRPVGIAITFGTVAFCWIFFRAENLDGALNILTGLVNFGGDLSESEIKLLFGGGIKSTSYTIGLFILAFPVVFLFPNAASYHLDGGERGVFRPDIPHLIFILCLWGAIIATWGGASEFLYFQF